MDRYQDRQDAGRRLAEYLTPYADDADTIVLALPRGGMPVAYEMAKRLHVPLDVFIVRKLGAPHHRELAIGAIASGGAPVFNREILRELHVSDEAIAHIIATEKKELARREKAYRGDKPFPVLKDKKIILVDDGIATGATMRAAISALRTYSPAAIIVAVPVADASLVASFTSLCDVFICPKQPDDLYAVGMWYEDFSQTEDEEVYDLLNK